MDAEHLPPEPWEQQPGEANRWYARFERYRLAGPTRSLLGILNLERQQRGAKKAKSLPQAWAHNAKHWRWRERAEAWDDQERQQARAAHAAEVKEMNHRHMQEARALQSKAVQRLKALEPEQLSATEVLRFCIESAKLERTALGEPETIGEQRLTGTGGGAVAFTLEDAVRADQELEAWEHERRATPGGGAPPPGTVQVP
jgi:hypothetical protein